MRAAFAIAGLIAAVPFAARAETSPMVRGSCLPHPASTGSAAAPSRANALALLGSVTQLQTSKRGRALLAVNLATTVVINNTASAAEQRLALRDAQVTAANAFSLADGLGGTMGDAYRRKAAFTSADDGATIQTEQVGPAIAELFKGAEAVSSGDSGEAKCAFANGVEPFQGGTYEPPGGGVLDIIGKAYGLPAGAPGGDKYGDPRPFQVAPPDGRGGHHIQTFEATDFFGVPMSSRVVLAGPTPEDRAAGRYAVSLADSPSFPSGHTTFAYTEALLLAMMVPERYQALAYRASEYGNSRIVLGAHYAIDVIAGRTLATYDLAQDLAGKSGYAQGFSAKLAAAARELRGYFQQNGCPEIAHCALEQIERAGEASVIAAGRRKPATPRDAYAFRLTYGLEALVSSPAAPDIVPAAAGLLLSTRFPYLTPEQRSDVLRSTEGPSGRFLDVDPASGRPIATLSGPAASQAGAYSRLDLFAAAGGYGAFSDQVVVEQDAKAISSPDLQPFASFAASDTWSNDIGGTGGLTKRGAGRLVLSGADTYAGTTLVEGGTLEIAGSVTSTTTAEAGGTLAGGGRLADVFVLQGGTLAPGGRDAKGRVAGMTIAGSLALAGGATLAVAAAGADPLARVGGHAILDAPKLVIAGKVKAGDKRVLIAAKDGVQGRFGAVSLTEAGLQGRLDYSADAVSLTIEPKDGAPH